MKFFILFVLLILPFFGFSQEINKNQSSKIYLINGEVYVGKIVAISDEFILLQSVPNVVSIKRNSVLYVLTTSLISPLTEVEKNTSITEDLESKMIVLPMNKNWMSEVETGMTFITPFFFKLGYKEWFRLNPKWHVALGTSLQFWRYSMLNANVSLRKIGTKNTFVKSFLEAEYGISYFENITNINGQGMLVNYPFHFSPVQQGNFGYGLWMDTSLGVVITTKISYSATGFSLKEQYNPNYEVKSRYFFSTLALSTSFIF